MVVVVFSFVFHCNDFLRKKGKKAGHKQKAAIQYSLQMQTAHRKKNPLILLL